MLFGALAIAQPAREQARPAGFTPADLAEIKTYRLSIATLRQVDAATRAFAATPRTDPAYRPLLKAQIEVEDPFGIKSTEHGSLAAIVYDVSAAAPMAAALAAHGLSPREYVKFLMVLVQSYMITELLAGAGPQIGRGIAVDTYGESAPPNLQFVTTNKGAVVSLLERIEAFTK